MAHWNKWSIHSPCHAFHIQYIWKTLLSSIWCRTHTPFFFFNEWFFFLTNKDKHYKTLQFLSNWNKVQKHNSAEPFTFFPTNLPIYTLFYQPTNRNYLHSTKTSSTKNLQMNSPATTENLIFPCPLKLSNSNDLCPNLLFDLSNNFLP